MKKILSVFVALCTVLTTLCIPPAPAVAQSTEPLASGHAIVVTGYNSKTRNFEFWNPWTNGTGFFLKLL